MEVSSPRLGKHKGRFCSWGWGLAKWLIHIFGDQKPKRLRLNLVVGISKGLFWVARDHVPKAREIASLNYATSWGPRFETHEPLGAIVYLKLNSMHIYIQFLVTYWKGLETVVPQ